MGRVISFHCNIKQSKIEWKVRIMRYEEPFVEMLIFKLGDVITSSPGDLGDNEAGGSGNGDDGVEYYDIN